jgi:lipid-A-disaccharide synthase-like uncharacterized protein
MREKLYVDQRLVVLAAEIGLIGAAVFAGRKVIQHNDEEADEQPSAHPRRPA